MIDYGYQGLFNSMAAVGAAPQEQAMKQAQIQNMQSLSKMHDVGTQKSAFELQQLQADAARAQQMRDILARSAMSGRSPQQQGQPQQGQPQMGGAPQQGQPQQGGMGQMGNAPQNNPMAMVDSQIERNTNTAQQLMEAGFVTEADGFTKSAMEMMNKKADFYNKQSDGAGKQLDQVKKVNEQVGEVANLVVDDASLKTFQQNVNMLSKINPNAVAPWMLDIAAAPSYAQVAPMIKNLQARSKEGLAAQETNAKITKAKADTALDAARTRGENLKNKRDQQISDQYKEYSDATKAAGGVPKDRLEWETGQKKPSVTSSALMQQRQDTLATNIVEFAKTLQNVTNLPATSTSGVYGKSSGTLLGNLPAAAANHLTSESVQRYKTEMGGLGNHLAYMVSGGMQPGQKVQEKFDELLQIREGDKPVTVLAKLARARQEAENVIAVKLRSKVMSEEMKDLLREQQGILEKTIPFSVDDVNSWSNNKTGKQTFQQFIQKSGVVPSSAAPTQDASKSSTPKMSPQEFNDRWGQLKSGESAIGPDGKTYTKR